MTGPLEVIARYELDHAVVSPAGEIFFDTVGLLRDALLPLAVTEHPQLILDLTDVTICDSSALNLMVQAHQLATEHGGWVRLVAPQPVVRRALEATNLTRILTIYKTVDAALAG